MIYWGIYDDYSIRRYKPKTNKALLIRALEPSYKEYCPYKISKINEYKDVLELYFEDIRDVPPEEYKDRFKLFDKSMAQQLLDFINSNEIEEVIVHCSAGISRSSALMICISKILGRDDLEEQILNCGRYYPNEVVLEIFNSLDFEVKYTPGELVCTKEINVNNHNNHIEVIAKNENGTYDFRLR